MAKNKDIQCFPSKGISIIIKNDIQQIPHQLNQKRNGDIKELMYYLKPQPHQ